MAKETTTKTSSNKVRPGRPRTSQVNTSKAGIRGTSKQPTARSVQNPVLMHEQIVERAKAIWRDRGCISGFDEQNWYEAETQLKTELGVH